MKQNMASEQKLFNRYDMLYMFRETFNASDYLYIFNLRIHGILKKEVLK